MTYIPKIQDIVKAQSNATDNMMTAVVISMSGYSKLTNLVVVSPIVTNANSNLKSFFIPIKIGSIEGYLNPLQIYTLDLQADQVKYTKMVLPDSYFFEISKVQKMMLNL